MIIIFLTLFSSQLFAVSFLDEYFKLKFRGDDKSAQEVLQKWNTNNFEESSYKKYFLSLSTDKAEDFWRLYQDISKNKKLLKLQHESIKKIIELDLKATKSIVNNFKKFDKVAKVMLERLQGQPEGVDFSAQYLKWILKNKKIRELCKAQRSRWISQTTLTLSEVMSGLDACPITYNDFVYRVRALIFSGNENKAQTEIEEFVINQKRADWEKAYLQAIYFTNVGDPTSAFTAAISYESSIKNVSEYYENLFYISQRAGELAKAEEIINNIIKTTYKKTRKKELIFQKAFLFYQTRRYIEANKLFSELIRTNSSHTKKNKSKEYDDLTWLSAWCYYLAKDYEKARESLTKNRRWANDKARNLYWLAQAEWMLDNRLVALSYYRQLALPVLNGKAFSYYNYLAWLRFEANKKFAASDLLKNNLDSIKLGRNLYALPDFSTDPSVLLEEYGSYFEDFGATDEGSVQIINQDEMALINAQEIKGIEINTSVDLKNQMSWADDLNRWGYNNLAKWHLYEVEKNLKTKNSVEPLIEYYRDKQYYNRALILANAVITPFGKNLNKREEPLLWSSLFPKAYESDVEKEAKKRKIHPYLVWSIMKAETQYKPDAISPVGAVGLMQFMPYTSKKVAQLLREDHRTEQLFIPVNAIKYGATYLKKLSDELGGQYPLIAAAYNGGPHRVKLWLRNFKDRDNTNMDYDVFIEHIPFNETRTYVKRVLSYILIYQKLYEDRLDAKTTGWIIEKIPFKLQEPIFLKEEWPIVQN